MAHVRYIFFSKKCFLNGNHILPTLFLNKSWNKEKLLLKLVVQSFESCTRTVVNTPLINYLTFDVNRSWIEATQCFLPHLMIFVLLVIWKRWEISKNYLHFLRPWNRENKIQSMLEWISLWNIKHPSNERNHLINVWFVSLYELCIQ